MLLVHIKAQILKRFYIYRRNYKGLIVEVLIPVLLVLIGFAFSKVTFFFASNDHTLSPSLLPLKQRILVNNFPVKQSANLTGNNSTLWLSKQLPDYSAAWDITMKNYTNANGTAQGEQDMFLQFDRDVFDNRHEGSVEPFRYGSYYIYEANNKTKQFKVSVFLNLTSQDVTALYPHFMYEAVLKSATGNSNLKFEVTTTPFPITQRMRNRGQAASGIFIVFVVSIGFALVPAAVVSFILNERDKNLKHMQLISGMNLLAYWSSNLIFDICKGIIPSAIVIGLMYAFSLDFPSVWILFLLYPVGVIPFTYVTSFLFTGENTAQTVTIFVHFTFAGIGAIVTYILRIIESTFAVGDVLYWVFKVIPSFCLTDSIMFSALKTIMYLVRPDIKKTSVFGVMELGGDILVLCLHFVFWLFVLMLIELGTFDCFKKCLLVLKRNRIPPKDNLDLDEDVLEEERRVAHGDPKAMQVRVHKFRKIYPGLVRKPQLAVERTSFGLEYGECFALLGVNGAGKTTTFKSLTSEIEPTSGELHINGLNTQKQFS